MQNVQILRNKVPLIKGQPLLSSQILEFEIEFEFLVFNTTFSNISAISWQPVLVVEEAGVPGENYRPWASNW